MILVHLLEQRGNFGHVGRPGQKGGSAKRDFQEPANDNPFKNTDSLPENEGSLIIDWTANGHVGIQKEERENPEGPTSKEFNSFLDKMPVYSGTVYRGIRSNTENLQRYLDLGGIITLQNSLSATKTKKVAFKEFAGRDLVQPGQKSVVLKISNKTAADVSKYTNENYPGQNEVILRKGRKYKITNVSSGEKDGVDYVISMEEI